MSETTSGLTGRRTTSDWITDGIIVAASPVVAYLFTWVYEAGYCSIFGIPRSFISLSLTTVFVVAGGLLFVGAVLFCLSNLIVIVGLVGPHTPIRRSLARLVPLALMLMAMLVLYGSLWREWIWLVAIVIGYAALEFAFPLITQRRG